MLEDDQAGKRKEKEWYIEHQESFMLFSELQHIIQNIKTVYISKGIISNGKRSRNFKLDTKVLPCVRDPKFFLTSPNILLKCFTGSLPFLSII